MDRNRQAIEPIILASVWVHSKFDLKVVEELIGNRVFAKSCDFRIIDDVVGKKILGIICQWVKVGGVFKQPVDNIMPVIVAHCPGWIIRKSIRVFLELAELPKK